jgi:hypothetical protein
VLGLFDRAAVCQSLNTLLGCVPVVAIGCEDEWLQRARVSHAQCD